MIFSNLIPAYVYYIEHIPSGKFYYGSRYKHINMNRHPEEDFLIHYFTSSKELKQLIKTNGVESFHGKIISTNTNHKVCYRYEQDLIKENKDNPLCLNKRFFDYEKSNTIFCNFGRTLSTKGQSKSEEKKANMRKPKSNQHRANISKAQQKNGGNGPTKHKEESKIKNGNTHRLLKRDKVTCPHCNKQGGAIAMPRWHFDNCKEKNVTSTI